jgi:carboxymethylenebutenolidase
VPGVNGKIGAVGYCLGGQLAYLTASRTDADAAVGFYAVMLQNRLDEKIAHPLMLHIADEDEFSSHENRDKVIAGLKDNPNVILHRYAGMNHAFARVGGKCYDKAAADLANSRTITFFKKELA